MKENDVKGRRDVENPSGSFDDDQEKKEKHEIVIFYWLIKKATVIILPFQKVLRRAILLSIVYAANIGGTASLTGTGTNLVLQEVFLM